MGIVFLQDEVAKLLPHLKDRVHELKDWKQCGVLKVDMGPLERWHREGLLLIGDAAHIMSPVGGVGINYAIQDAIAAANILRVPLRNKSVTDSDWASVQKRREKATRFIQNFQIQIQKRVIAFALKSDKPFRAPLPVRIISRLPFLRGIPAKLLAYGRQHESYLGC